MTHSIFLSILIPVYNWDVSSLLEHLVSQTRCLQNSNSLEIIVMDDGSSWRYEISSSLLDCPLIHYHAFDENRGRAAIRQMLLNESAGECVLFLDADMLPDDDCFLQRYVEHAEAGNDIVCGGISYLQHRDEGGDFSFYLYKSAKTEAIPAEKRRRAPWRYLFTSNVMVRRQVAETVPFDCRFSGYGFEDIEWGLRLSEIYKIQHIDNTCTHMGLQTQKQTFAKMRESIDNYVLLLTLHPRQTERSSAVRTSRFLNILPTFFLHRLDRVLSALFFAAPSHALSFVFFQCDKMILLAKALKEKR